MNHHRNISQPRSYNYNNNYAQKKTVSQNTSIGHTSAKKNHFNSHSKISNISQGKQNSIIDEMSQQSSRTKTKTNQQLPVHLNNLNRKEPKEFKMNSSNLILRNEIPRKNQKRTQLNNNIKNYSNNSSYIKPPISLGKDKIINVDPNQHKAHQCSTSIYNNSLNTNLRNNSPFRDNKNEVENGMISNSMISSSNNNNINNNNNLFNQNSVGSYGSKSMIYTNPTYDNLQMRTKKNNIQFINNNNFNYNDLTKLTYQPQQQQQPQQSSHFNRSSSQITHNNIHVSSMKDNYKYGKRSLDDNLPVSLNDIYTSRNGLINTMNTCYMNTCLQILTHCPTFVKYLFQDEFNGNKLHISPKIEINNEQLITSLLKDIMLKLTKRHYNPETFIDSFIKVHSKTYTRYIQQDTVEFCRTLLEDISKETNKVKNKTQYQELDTKNKSKIELNKEYDLLFRKREDSFVIDTFYIQLSSTFKCDKCGFDSYSFQKILDLPLLIPLEINNPSKPNVSSSYINSSSQSRMVQREISVIDLCKNYFKEESYDWSDKCEGCNSQTKHIKKVQIASLPPVLILSIQRYNYNLTFPYKDNTTVSFKEELLLTDFIDNDLCDSSIANTKYYLFGLMNHKGTMDFGHYYAYVKVGNIWYEYNDCQVSQIKPNFSDRNIYCLFYIKDAQSLL